MEELLMQMLEKAKTERRLLVAFKNLDVKMQQFELASRLRDIEIKYFPETEQEKELNKSLGQIDTALRMVGFEIPKKNLYRIIETIKTEEQKKGSFMINDAIDINTRAENIFITD